MLRRPAEYKASLRSMRPNIYKFGELIEDVTTHPATRRCVEGHAKIFEISLEKEYEDLATTTSNLSKEKISRYLSIIMSPEDMIANCKLKRLMFNLTGTCTGGRCVGWNSINAVWNTTYEIDAEYGTEYHRRFKKWLLEAQKRDIAVAGAMTDPKGSRTLPPSKQKDKDLYLHIVEDRNDGIVVRGAKVMIAGVSAANEVFVLPGMSYGEEDKEYAVAFVIPRDVENLTIVEARRPSDGREYEEGFDIPVERGGITQSYLYFKDVFVPKERVFLCKEYKYTRNLVMHFIVPYRAAIGSCVAGQGDVMLGAAIALARSHGLSEKVFSEKIVKMCVNNETTFGMGIASAVDGKKLPSGGWEPEVRLANITKIHTATLPYETKLLAQEISGGIAETGCMPSWKDFSNAKYGKEIQKYLSAEYTSEERFKLARLVEWLTVGAGIPGCLHGGGSPETAKRIVRDFTNIEKYVEMAKKLVGI